MALLIQNKGKLISSDVLIDTVWPNENKENGSHLLRNAVYNIRMALTKHDISEEEISIQERYCLKVGDADIDIDAYYRHYRQLRESADIESYIDCVRHYTGGYCLGDGWLWAEQEKAALQKCFLWVVSQAAELLKRQGRFTEAEELILKGLKEEPCEEGLIMQLLDIYEQNGEHIKAARLYKNYKNMLISEFGCLPSAEIAKYS